MMVLFVLLSIACGPKHTELTQVQEDHDRLQVLLVALAADQEDLAARLADIEARLDAWDRQGQRGEPTLAEAQQTPAPLHRSIADAAPPPGCELVEKGRYRLNHAFGTAPALELAKEVRVIAHQDTAGSVVGFRLLGLRQGTNVASCGFRNGDILHALGGQALTSVEAAQQAYASLQTQTEATVDVTRRGQRIRWVLELQPPRP